MITLRQLKANELAAASRLCLRSKAFWGYDAEFMRLCKTELTLDEADLKASEVVVAISGEQMLGVAQVTIDRDDCHLEKLFVDADTMGRGVGRALFDWAANCAMKLGAKKMIVEADPDAVPFYNKMGCRETGKVSSGSIPGRNLPRLVLTF